MPKAPNLSNPLAAIRHRMEMKLEDFAEFIGHGAPMLKHIEAGRKPMSDELRDKIHLATGVPYSLLDKERLSEKDREKLNGLTVAAFAGPNPSGLGIEPLLLLPDIMAVYFALLKSGIRPKLALIPLQREIARTLTRWGGNSESSELAKTFGNASAEFHARLFAVRGDQQGKVKPFCDTILDALADSGTFKDAKSRHDAWVAKIEKKFEAGSVKSGLKAVEIELTDQKRKARSRSR